MAQPIWKGHISFGLVNVPVSLFSAERREEVNFHLIDSRDVARVRYQRVNSETGEEVPWDKIVKGYEYTDGSYVLLSDKELEAAAGELARSIDIQEFVKLDQIHPMFFEKPYYLTPNKQGEKGYVLLREAMAHTGKAGIARVAIRTRQYLAALMAQGNVLLLNLLRFAQDLRDPKDYDLPTAKPRDYDVTAKELQLASRLIQGMTGTWKPQQYRDDSRDALMRVIEKKIKQGKTESIAEPEEAEPESTEGKTLNFIQALKKSVAQSTGHPPARRKTARHSSGRGRKQKAG